MTFDEHKINLGKILSKNSIKPKSKRGGDIIWAYWLGVMAETQEPYPIVDTLLYCGRMEELQTPPEKS